MNQNKLKKDKLKTNELDQNIMLQIITDANKFWQRKIRRKLVFFTLSISIICKGQDPFSQVQAGIYNRQGSHSNSLGFGVPVQVMVCRNKAEPEMNHHPRSYQPEDKAHSVPKYFRNRTPDAFLVKYVRNYINQVVNEEPHVNSGCQSFRIPTFIEAGPQEISLVPVLVQDDDDNVQDQF